MQQRTTRLFGALCRAAGVISTLFLLQACGTQPSLEQSVSKLDHETQHRLTHLETPDHAHEAPRYTSLWVRLSEGFSLPCDPEKPDIARHIKRYRLQPHHVQELAERAAPYLYLIAEAVEARQMPMEIALLPMVESAFDPFALSQGKAAGIWQIIPDTARSLGLKRDAWYDGRKDLVASTEAALDYLSYLSQRFDGDWLLALAAYNSGEGTVARAITHNTRRQHATQFHDLNLPQQTRDYVPKLLALVTLVREASRTSQKASLPHVPDQPYVRAVDLGTPMDLGLAAELAEMDLRSLYRLNPGYTRWSTHPDAEGPHHVLLPLAHAERFEQKVAALPTDQWVNWRNYRIRPGDSLSVLAHKNHTTVAHLMEANGLQSTQLRYGTMLRLPQPIMPHDLYRLATQTCQFYVCAQEKHLIHEVREGESLWRIGKRYGAPAQDIAHWNVLNPQKHLQPGQKLIIKTHLAKNHVPEP